MRVRVEDAGRCDTGNRPRRPRRPGVVFAGAVLAVVVVLGGAVFMISGGLDRVRELSGHRAELPAPDPTLTGARAAIVDAARAEYERNPEATTYSEGVREPWCADFVSWVRREAGVPLSNPNSGSWRIPGVLTLTDHLREIGALRPASYVPEPGDIVLYDRPSPLGQHTNLVIARVGDQVTTIGGNENGGEIRVRTYDLSDEAGIQGYGAVQG